MPQSNIQEELSLEERVMRVTAGLYRVTDVMLDDEPMKWKMRKDALEILEHTEANFLKNNNTQSDMLEQTQKVCHALRSKLSVAEGGGFIARMNFQVLEDEYKNISDIISNNLSDMSYMRYTSLLDFRIGHDFFKKDIKDIEKKSGTSSENNRETEQQVPHEGTNLRKKNDMEPSSSFERHETIKKVLQERGWLGVGEIVALCSSSRVSVKTVQRDLNSLVASGAINGRGERRWRKYTLHIQP